MGLEISILSLTFVVLGLVIFILGLFANRVIDDSYLPPILYQFLRYGRANDSAAKPKSKLLEWVAVPKSWFAHFYLYCTIIQSFVLSTVVILYIFGNSSIGHKWLSWVLDTVAGTSRTPILSPARSLLISILFLIQVSRRYYETKYIAVYSDTKMNVIHYFAGFLHYSGSTLSLLASSPGFGIELPSKHELVSLEAISAEMTPINMLGFALFIYGTIRQYQAHHTFANLRTKGGNVVTRAHKIPSGGLFELVSCPNYWAEILIYSSFGILFRFQNPCWNAVLFWVICNQVTAGVMNHIWYLEKFPDYPKNRKAIIPYVW